MNDGHFTMDSAPDCGGDHFYYKLFFNFMDGVMKTLLMGMFILGEILVIRDHTADVTLTITQGNEVEHVKKTLSLEDFPCNPYQGMLFYYAQSGNTQYIRCGEPEPN